MSVLQAPPGTLLAVSVLAAAALPATAQEDCTACHEEPAPDAYEQSVHGFFECTDCHGGVDEFPHASPVPPPDCSACHGDVVQAYAEGVHAGAGRPAGAGVPATCHDCHGAHDIRPSTDKASRTYHLNVPDTCARCHGPADPDAEALLPAPKVYASFDDSIHGVALREHGLLVAPSCASCHGSHGIRGSSDPESPVHRSAIPERCGSCHAGILAKYEESVHSDLLASGNLAVAVCTDCHNTHEIGTHEVSGWRLDVIKECGTCHEPSIETYRDTFHGQVTSLGFSRVATCADCHGSHDILPKDSPASRVSGERLLATCQTCHPGASPSFVLYDPHPRPDDPSRSRAVYVAKKSMQLLLAGVFTFFFIHTALWLPRSFQMAARKRRAEGAAGRRGTGGGSSTRKARDV